METKDLVAPLISMLSTAVPLIAVGIFVWVLYVQIQKYWVESKPNEWMLVLRNGQCVKSGIGLCTWIMPGD
jgi:hypothetical protein